MINTDNVIGGNVDIEDVKNIESAGKEMRATLSTAISDAVEIFKKNSGGYSPSDIVIQMLDVSTISDIRKQYVVGYIRIYIAA